jgi:DNA replication and repair protein RecF
MQVRSLHLSAFRNHADSHLQFGTGITLLLGNNGQGKTNVLEAVSYLSLSKSFYAASDLQVVMLGRSIMEIQAAMADAAGRESRVRISVDALTGEKNVQVNGSALDRMSALIGMFPAVILSPEQAGIITGSPAERRKFLDLVLCQTSRTYFADVVEYRRVLRQRNTLLLDARLGGTSPAGELPAWNDELVRLGSRLIHKRAALIDGLREEFGTAYNFLAGAGVSAAVRYVTVGGVDAQSTVETIAEHFGQALERRSAEERRRGATLVGPHRDDLAFTINGLASERYASQGEHKTLLIALKLAEYEYITGRCGETPMLLLDDIFAELDRQRAACVMQRLQTKGQSIVTATDESLIGQGMRWTSEHRRIIVDGGRCREAAF